MGQKQAGNGAFVSLRKVKAEAALHPGLPDCRAAAGAPTTPTWAQAAGPIRDRGGVLRVIASSSLIFLTNGFHLFRERMILFKTESEIIMRGEGS